MNSKQAIHFEEAIPNIANRQNIIRSHQGVLISSVVGSTSFLGFCPVGDLQKCTVTWSSGPVVHCFHCYFLHLWNFVKQKNFRKPGRGSSSTFLLNAGVQITTNGPIQRPRGQWRLAFFPYLFLAAISLKYYYWTSRNMSHFVVFSKTNQLASIFFQSLTCSHWVRGVSCFCKPRLYLPIGWGLKVVSVKPRVFRES